MRDLNEILSNKYIWGHNIMFPMHTAWIKLTDCGTCSTEDGADITWGESYTCDGRGSAGEFDRRIHGCDPMCIIARA